MVGVDAKTGKILEKIDSCIMCKRVVINSGIKYVVVKDINSESGYKIIDVEDWVKFDEVLENNVKKIINNK
jgi:dCMP deaminase